MVPDWSRGFANKFPIPIFLLATLALFRARSTRYLARPPCPFRLLIFCTLAAIQYFLAEYLLYNCGILVFGRLGCGSPGDDSGYITFRLAYQRRFVSFLVFGTGPGWRGGKSGSGTDWREPRDRRNMSPKVCASVEATR